MGGNTTWLPPEGAVDSDCGRRASGGAVTSPEIRRTDVEAGCAGAGVADTGALFEE